MNYIKKISDILELTFGVDKSLITEENRRKRCLFFGEKRWKEIFGSYRIGKSQERSDNKQKNRVEVILHCKYRNRFRIYRSFLPNRRRTMRWDPYETVDPRTAIQQSRKMHDYDNTDPGSYISYNRIYHEHFVSVSATFSWISHSSKIFLSPIERRFFGGFFRLS